MTMQYNDTTQFTTQFTAQFTIRYDSGYDENETADSFGALRLSENYRRCLDTSNSMDSIGDVRMSATIHPRDRLSENVLSLGFRESRIGIGPFPFTISQRGAQSKSETFLARFCFPAADKYFWMLDTFRASLLQFYCLRVHELTRNRHAFHACTDRYVRVHRARISSWQR